MSYAQIINGGQGGNLWIGSMVAARDPNFLRQARISFIIDVSNSNVVNPLSIPTWHAKDIPDAELPSDPRAAIQHIVRVHSIAQIAANGLERELRGGGNVLVHCAAGINRSATVIAAYLILKCGLPYEKAVSVIEQANKTRHLPALTNNTFRHILVAMSKK